MTKPFANFEEWRAQKEFVTDLALRLDMHDENDSVVEMRGFIYPDGAWIELEDSGQWHTIVGNTEEFNYNIKLMEHYLWSVHSCQHIQTPREVLTEELNNYCNAHNLEHRSADELLVDAQVKETMWTNHAHWLEAFCQRWEELED